MQAYCVKCRSKREMKDAKGITMKDLELARKIEDVVAWQPGAEQGALEGTPQGDLRFSYIKYD